MLLRIVSANPVWIRSDACALILQNDLAGGGGTEGVYGSLTQMGMQRIFECFYYNTGFGPTSTLVDVGAGMCRQAPGGAEWMHSNCVCMHVYAPAGMCSQSLAHSTCTCRHVQAPAGAACTHSIYTFHSHRHLQSVRVRTK